MQRYQNSPLNTNTHDRRFAGEILKCISSNEIYWFRMKLQWNIYYMVQIDNTQTLVQAMA